MHTLTLMQTPSVFLNLSRVRASGDDTSDESMFTHLNDMLGSQGGTIVATGSFASGGVLPLGNRE